MSVPCGKVVLACGNNDGLGAKDEVAAGKKSSVGGKDCATSLSPE